MAADRPVLWQGQDLTQLSKSELQKMAAARDILFEKKENKGALADKIVQHEEDKAAAAAKVPTLLEVKRMSVQELRAWLTEKDFESKGNKEALVARIMASLAPPAPPAPFVTGA